VWRSRPEPAETPVIGRNGPESSLCDIHINKKSLSASPRKAEHIRFLSVFNEPLFPYVMVAFIAGTKIVKDHFFVLPVPEHGPYSELHNSTDTSYTPYA